MRLAVPVSSVMTLTFLICPLIGQQPFSLLAASLYLPRRPRLPFRVSPTALGGDFVSTIRALEDTQIPGVSHHGTSKPAPTLCLGSSPLHSVRY